MKKIDIEKNHIVTREELHDLMMSYNFNEEEKIDEEKLSKAIYELIDDTYNANSTENEFDLDIKINMYFQDYFRNMLLLTYKENSYIYWIEDKSKSDEVNYANKKEFIECLLDNDYNLDTNHLLELLAQTKEDLNYIRKSESLALTSIKELYENYDYVKMIKDKYNNINYFDVISCKQYLELSNDNKSNFSLTIDEKICLCLIILYGLKNTYFYSSELSKISIPEYYTDINNINVWINFIEDNKDNISKEKIWSKEYECHINLKDRIRQFSMVQEKDSCHIIRRYLRQNYLKETLQLIYFEYLINNKRFKEARKYLGDKPIYLYSYLDKTLIPEVDDDEIIEELIYEIVTDYKIDKYDTFACEASLNDLLSDNTYKNKYVVPVLRFIINYLYLLKVEGKEKQVQCLYSFLKIFEKGFGKEEFFIKFDYELMLSKLTQLKIDGKDLDTDDIDIDKIINNIAEQIDESKLVDKYDIERVSKMYPYIHFENLDDRVKKYIATGDTIMMVFDDSNNIGFDYSSAVIEWCKAVELETWEKLTKKIKNNNRQICNEIDPFKYKKREDYRELTPKEVSDLRLKSTIGTFDAIDIRFVKDGRTLSKYLYDEYYSKIYNFSFNQYDELIKNILKIYVPRNNSAHKNKTINLKDAQECQSVILSAKKILEVLSTLKCK